MPTANVDAVLRVGAQVCYGATDLSAAFPHGGTSLGVIGGPPVWRWLRAHHEEKGGDDKFAGQITGLKFAGEQVVVGLNLKQWDLATIGALTGNVKTVSGGPQLVDGEQANTTKRPGSDVPSIGNLVVSPKNPTHPALILYDVYAITPDEEEMAFAAITELMLSVVFIARSTGTRMWAMDTLARLSL